MAWPVLRKELWPGQSQKQKHQQTQSREENIAEMLDGSSNNMIWRGAASDTLSNNTDKNIKNLDKNVQKMFGKFPPNSNHR